MKTFKQYINEHFSYEIRNGRMINVSRSDEYNKLIDDIVDYSNSNDLTFNKEESVRQIDMKNIH